MIYRIPQGKHRARPLRFGLYFRQEFKWTIRFNDTSVYQIDKQGDINKLCGIRYLFGDNSARFGWRYVPDTGLIDIMAYVHDDGKVTKSEREIIITRVHPNELCRLSLSVRNGLYWFNANGHPVKVVKTHHQKISFRQGLFFGGTTAAPHDITVEIKTR